jgi:hypothetical protein
VKSQNQETVELGELIEGVYDETAPYSADPREMTSLATQTVVELLWRAPRPKRSPPTPPHGPLPS